MNKLKQYIFLILFMVIGLSSKAQLNFAEVDSNTYKLCITKQWNQLIVLGESAIKDGVDYMFLRQRIGIAYYNLNNYRMAAYHLEKALAFNSDDDYTLTYLYYSYLYSGRQSDANFITRNMAPYVKENLKWKNKYISSVYFECGKSFSNNISKNGGIDYDGNQNIYGENNMCDGLYYYHIGLKHEVLPFLSFYHGFSKINISNEKIITYNKNINHAKDTVVDTLNNYNINQYEYYISSDIQLMKGLKLTPAFHYLHVGFSNITYDTTNDIIATKTTSLNNYVVSLAITKEFQLISLGLFASKSNLNNLNQYVFGSTFNFFPNGNLNFYTSTTLSFILEKGNLNGTPKRWIFDQLVGHKLFGNLWGEASLTLGDLTDFNEKNAFILYNTFDNIKFKAGASLIYTLNKHLEVSFRYQILSRQDSYLTYTSKTQTTRIATYYNNNTLIGGLKWKL